MTKGELEKRIIEFKIVTGQYPGQSDVLHPFWKGIPSDFLDVLKEARKEFPKKLIEEQNLEYPWQYDLRDWFVKWFGDEVD